MHSFFAKKSTAAGDGAEKKVVKKSNFEERKPWVEKYRPNKVDEVVSQNEIVAVLKKVLEGADLPNILFYGPPGTGKTSAALALCKQMFKTQEVMKDRVLEMNASDERGIAVVRTKIKEFAQRAVAPTSLSGQCASIKIIILDEADAMTHAAQAAMRRIIETYSSTTRFFLICNYISRIIAPLTSRCAKFRFKPLPVDDQLTRLKFICQNENVTADDNALTTLINLCEGDLRKSVGYLQALASTQQTIDGEFLRQVTGSIADDMLDRTLKNLSTASKPTVYTMTENIMREGYSAKQFMHQLLNRLIDHEYLTDMQKAEIFEKMSVCEMRLINGANEFLQLLDLFFCVQTQFVNPKSMGRV
ncbi:unnamed protein product [Auanema sp. JU1783]|nr:unnamed protein product [Auanema sp. JU1783]